MPTDTAARLSKVHLMIVQPPVPSLGGLSIADLEATLEKVDALPVDRISGGDHQGNHLELYSTLGFMAARTSRVHLGPYVTNAAARDPGVHAAAMVSLDALSGGRTFFVLGRGDGVVHNLGLVPNTIAQTLHALVVIRELFRAGECTIGQRTIRLRWPESVVGRCPLYVAAAGPRMLRAAAEVADGVYVAAGLTTADVSQAISMTAAGAAGRAAPLDVWWVVRFGIGETTAAAIASVGESISSIGNHALRGGDYEQRGVPQELWPALRQYHDRYDWSLKSVPGAGAGNVDLMTELGLRDYFLERFAVAGTPDQLVVRLRELAGRGVRQVVLSVRSYRDLELLGEVLPAVVTSDVTATGTPR